MKNLAPDPEIEFLTQSILKSYGCAAAMPTVWELIGYSTSISMSPYRFSMLRLCRVR